MEKKQSNSGSSEFIVGTRVRELIKSKDCMTSAEFLPALSALVEELVEKACERAKENKRSTLRPYDL